MIAPVKQTTAQISQALAFLIPTLLGVYWPLYLIDPAAITMALRVGICGLAALLAIFWLRAPLTHAELRFSALLFGFCALILIPSLTATNTSRALTGWVKVVILCGIGLGLSRSLRHRGTASAFGLGMLIASLVSSLYIVAIYVQHMGMVLPTYEATRIMKGTVFNEGGVALNPIASSAVFAYVMSVCLIRPNRLTLALGIPVFAVAFALSGSRAPAGIVLLSGMALITLNILRSRSLAVRVVIWTGVIAAGGLIAVLAFSVDASAFAAFTEGRSDLWTVAWTRFLERPLTGYGFESWRDDFYIEGGYHSEYFTLLAEQGLVGFVLGLVIFSTLLRSCWRLAFDVLLESRNAQFLLFACLYLPVRAFVETPGLFGYAQEPSDYFAYCFLAVVISRLSVVEDFTRTTAEPAWSSVSGVQIAAGRHEWGSV